MKNYLRNILTSLLSFLLFSTFIFCQAPNLATVSNFAVFTSAGAFNNLGASNIAGDVGTNVGAFTGFPLGIINGQIHVANATSAQAATDLATAYAQLATSTCGAVISTTLGNNQTLTPNVYCMGAATTLNGDLILDGQGNSNAIFIFQIDGAFSTSTYTNIILINGATACNVFWQVNGAFALGDYSVFRGTLLINGAISLLEGSSLYGRALTKAGAVDLHNNIVAAAGVGALTCSPITIGVGVDATSAVNTAITPSGSTITWNTGNAITATSYTSSISGSCGNSSCTNTITRVQGSISSYIWTDVNGDGINNEASGAGINGITVELWNATTNTFVATSVTSNNAGNPGYCNFNINIDGDYKIKFPTNYLGNSLTIQTTTPATDNNSDANITTGFSPTFTILLSGTGSQVNNTTIDAGYLPFTTPSAGVDQVTCGGFTITLTGTNPTTGTWTMMAGNPIGASINSTISGVTQVSFITTASGIFSFIYTTAMGYSDTVNVVVTAKPNAGANISTCFINGNAIVTLSAIGIGTWTIQSGNSGTSIITTPTSATTTITNFSISGIYNYIWASNGYTDTILVIITPNGNIGNYVWRDINGDGINNEASNQGINGVAVELWNATNNTLIATTTTANNSGNPGYFNFVISTNGDYKVKFPTTYTGNNLTTPTTSAATDNNSDANISTGFSPTFTITILGTGSQINNSTIDAGYLVALCSSLTNVSLCPTAMPYIWNGNSYNAAGTYIIHLTNSVGGDSTAILSLTVKATSTSTINVCLCPSAMPFTLNGFIYNIAGTFIVMLTNSVGCDSIFTLYLSVKSSSTSITNTSVCSTAMPYVWNGNTYNATGSYIVHLTNSLGCDSAATLNLTNGFPSSSNNSISICSSLMPYTWNAHTCNVAGVYTVNLTNSFGCDSAATLNLTVKTTSTSSTSISICPSLLPYTWNNHTYNTAGTYIVHLNNSIGCDSAATLILTTITSPATPSITGTSFNVCAPSTVLLTSSAATNNQWYKDGILISLATLQNYTAISSGNYSVLVTGASCTSSSSVASVTIGMVTTPIIALTGTPSLCAGGTVNVQLCPQFYGYSNYQWYKNGTAIAVPNGISTCLYPTTTGSYTVNGSNGLGCWSSQSTPLVINDLIAPTAPVISAGGSINICLPSSVILTATVSSNYQWYANGTSINGATLQTYTATYAGMFTVKTIGANGCSSLASNSITVTSTNPTIPSITANGSTSVCAGSTVLLTSSNSLTYQWYKNGALISAAILQNYPATTSGNYVVIVTNASGCSSSSSTITINISSPSTPIITPTDTVTKCISSSVQLCPASYGYSSYQWYLNGIAIASPNGNGSCLYPTAAGVYTVAGSNGASCWSSQSASVKVKDSVCVGVVTSGGTGGTESKTLGNIIASRLYGNAINSIAETNGYSNSVKFNNSGAIVNGANDLTLSILIPTTLANTDNAYITTPTDLLNFTNAIEVLAVDYTNANITKAVAFGTKTLGGIYNHTKPICDRLKGAELLEVKNITVNGFRLMAYKIHQKNGEIEYAINLSAGTATNRSSISLQSNWFTDSYQQDEKLYNFQLWAISYEMVTAMATNIITKLQTIGTVNSTTNANLPKAYISKGAKKGTNLTVTIQNNTSNTTGYFSVKEKANEQMNDAQITTRQIPFTLNANGITNISFPVDDYYEGSIYVYVNNSVTDLVYLADGTWSIDYNQATSSISSFNVVNESPNALIPNNGEYRIFRNVEVNAITKDYISIYKTMLGGGLEQNLSTYNSLLFNANTTGASTIKVTLVKKSITNWDDQYSYTIPVTVNQQYALDFTNFKSSKFNSFIHANDITVINFSFINNRGGIVSMNVSLNDVKFSVTKTNYNVTPVIAAPINLIAVYPNPSIGNFIIGFDAQTAMPLVMKMVNVSTGKQVKTQFINTTKGANHVAISMDNVTIVNGVYLISLDGDNVNYKTISLMLLNK